MVRLELLLPVNLKNSSLCEAELYFCTGIAMSNNCISRSFYHLTKIYLIWAFHTALDKEDDASSCITHKNIPTFLSSYDWKSILKE